MPAVLLVVQGGPGTLKTVLLALGKGVPVLLIGDSLGAASAIRDFLTRTKEDLKEISDAEKRKAECEAAHKDACGVHNKALGVYKATATEEAKAAWIKARAAMRKAQQELSRADNLLLAHECKLFKDAGLATAFSKPRLIAQLRDIYAKKDLVELYALAENATDDISQVTATRSGRARIRARARFTARREDPCTAVPSVGRRPDQ